MSDQIEKRLTWLAFVYDSAIKHGVFRPADVVVHATPDVLARDLPKELLIRIFEVAFDAGKLTPEGMLGVAPPSTLVKHIAPAILWETVRDAATRHGIALANGNMPKTGKTPLRGWLAEVIAAGIDRDIYTPADITRHIPPGEWVKDVPLEVVARMIASGLTRPSFDPRLALEHLTPQVIGEYVAPNLSWAVIEEGAVRAFELSIAKVGNRLSVKPPVVAAAVHAPAATPVAAAVATPVAVTAEAPALVGKEAAAPAPDWSAEAVDSWVESESAESSSTAT